MERTGKTSLRSDLAEPTQILYVEASHHDPATAYLTVGATRESTAPYVARTDDYGKTWQKIVNGFPEKKWSAWYAKIPSVKGLLYAGTDTGMYVSWDRRRPLAAIFLESARNTHHRSPGA